MPNCPTLNLHLPTFRRFPVPVLFDRLGNDIGNYVYVQVKVYIYKYIHTYIHTYVRTYIHTYIHTYGNLVLIAFDNYINYIHTVIVRSGHLVLTASELSGAHRKYPLRLKKRKHGQLRGKAFPKLFGSMWYMSPFKRLNGVPQTMGKP